MNAEELCLRAVAMLMNSVCEKPKSFLAALRYALLTARRLNETRKGRRYLYAIIVAILNTQIIYQNKWGRKNVQG